MSLSGLNLQGAITALTAPLADEVVSVDLGSGTVTLNLAALVSTGPDGLNNLDPNTELLLNAAAVNDLVDRIGDLIDTRLDQVVSVIRTALSSARLTVALNAGVVLDLGLLLGGELEVANLAIGLNAPLGSLSSVSSPPALTLEVSALRGLLPGLVPVVDGLLTPVRGLLQPLTTELITPIATVVTDSVVVLVDDLGRTLADVVTEVVEALSIVLAPLPSVLSVTVNVQPDQPCVRGGVAYEPCDPPGTTYAAADSDSSAQYKVTALRLGVGDGLGGLAFVELGTASAGPVAAP